MSQIEFELDFYELDELEFEFKLNYKLIEPNPTQYNNNTKEKRV